MTYPQQPQYGAPPQGYAPPPPNQPMMYGQPGVPAPQAYAQPQQGTGQFFTQQDPHVQAQQPPAAPPQFTQPPPAPQPVDTSSFFGGAATISFDDRKGYARGTFRGGQIISKSVTQQTKMGTGEKLTWNDGSARMQLVLLLQTRERTDPQDNGQRQLFIKGDAPRAARVAFEAVGAKDLIEGGWYYQAWVDEKPPSTPGYNPQKVFKALYAPPGSPDPLADQPAYTAGPAMPTQLSANYPPPSATPDQFAAYAAWQAQQRAAQAPGPLAAAPAQHMASFAQAAQHDPAVQAAIYGQQPGGQPQTEPALAQPMTPQQGTAPEQWTPFAT